MKDAFLSTLTAVGAGVASTLLGGWDKSLEILLIFIVMDYLTGVGAAFKTKTLKSSVGFKGLMKKGAIFLIVILAAQLDRITGNTAGMFRTVTAFFIANEGLSMVENVGEMGVKLPGFITSALTKLRDEQSTPDTTIDDKDELLHPARGTMPQAHRLRPIFHATEIHEARSQRSKRHAILASGHIMEVRMTSSQRSLLRELRRFGKSYGQIAEALNLSENTVKSFCRREGILAVPESAERCPHCGKPMSPTARGTRRRFYSDTCRYAWNFAHRVLDEKNAISKRCACCGKPFFSYPSSCRKYCFLACYIRDRFGKEARHDARAL
jgi:toxin secretion/phage lysis holin